MFSNHIAIEQKDPLPIYQGIEALIFGSLYVVENTVLPILHYTKFP